MCVAYAKPLTSLLWHGTCKAPKKKWQSENWKGDLRPTRANWVRLASTAAQHVEHRPHCHACVVLWEWWAIGIFRRAGRHGSHVKDQSKERKDVGPVPPRVWCGSSPETWTMVPGKGTSENGPQTTLHVLTALWKVPWEWSICLLESVLFRPLGHTGEQFLWQQEDQHSRTCGILMQKSKHTSLPASGAGLFPSRACGGVPAFILLMRHHFPPFPRRAWL